MKRTPLHVLLNQSVDPQIREIIQRKQLEILDFFIRLLNADINAKDMDGFTALHFACKFNNFLAVKYLISNDNINLYVLVINSDFLI
jgi:ankyrin repeat protein